MTQWAKPIIVNYHPKPVVNFSVAPFCAAKASQILYVNRAFENIERGVFMKNLLLVLSLIASTTTFATNSFMAKVDDVFCGEMDPFVIGDVCVVNLTKEEDNKKLALLFDFDEFTTAYSEGELSKKLVEIDSSVLALVTDRDQLVVLRDFDSTYFYMFAEVKAIQVKSDSYLMEEFINLTAGTFSTASLPLGYAAKKVDKLTLSEGFKYYLKSLTKDKKADWKNYVLFSGEYDNRTLAQVKKIIENPTVELGVEYLLEIEDVYAVYKGNKLIGYFMQIADHVQAAIYQDGAWIDMFLNTQLRVLKSIDQSA